MLPCRLSRVCSPDRVPSPHRVRYGGTVLAASAFSKQGLVPAFEGSLDSLAHGSASGLDVFSMHEIIEVRHSGSRPSPAGPPSS